MSKKEYIKNCAVCQTEFKAFKSTQRVCSYSCSLEYAKTKRKKEELKEWNKRKKVLKEELKTVQTLMKEAQVIFNKYIRLRDKDQPCISCGKSLKGKFDAGHLFSSGGHKRITFHIWNVNGQCVECNQHKHGNLLEYRKGLIERHGIAAYQQLEMLANETKKYTREELREIKEYYKQKIKELSE